MKANFENSLVSYPGFEPRPSAQQAGILTTRPLSCLVPPDLSADLGPEFRCSTHNLSEMAPGLILCVALIHTVDSAIGDIIVVCITYGKKQG